VQGSSTPASKVRMIVPESISTVGWEAYANGGNHVDWPGLGSTGDAATAKAGPFTPNTLPLPLPCRDPFFTANEKDSIIYLVFEICTNLSQLVLSAAGKIVPNLGFAGAWSGKAGVQGAGSRSVFGGGVAGTRDRAPDLAPAQPPLACPLQPTGGDALKLLHVGA
jgi:hypothetical protein